MHLSGLSALERLNLSENSSVHDAGLAALCRLSRLACLDLSYTGAPPPLWTQPAMLLAHVHTMQPTSPSRSAQLCTQAAATTTQVSPSTSCGTIKPGVPQPEGQSLASIRIEMPRDTWATRVCRP